MKNLCEQNNIKIVLIPSGHTAVYQPLDTHINGIVASKLSTWHNQQLDEQKTVTLAARKDQATDIFRKLKASTVRRAFIESLLIPSFQHVPPVVPVVTVESALKEVDSIMAEFNRPN